MKSMLMCMGGPVIPASNSRATVRSEVSFGSSRCPIPAGRTHASVSRSKSQAATRLPRLAPIAWCTGTSTWRRMKTHTHDGERLSQSLPPLHRRDQPPHGDGKRRRQHASQQEDRPPGRRQPTVRLGQDGKELPLLPFAQPMQHGGKVVSLRRRGYGRQPVRMPQQDPKRMRRPAAVCVALSVFAGAAVADDRWTEFRGPSGTGHSDSTGLPREWGETKNVAWKTRIHGRGWSSPVVLGKQVWLTTATPDGKELSVLALDRDDGRVLFDPRSSTWPSPRTRASTTATPRRRR